MVLKPVSHCAISCVAMLHRRRLPDIAQCERFCDAIFQQSQAIASHRGILNLFKNVVAIKAMICDHWLFCDGFSVDRGRGGDSPLIVAGYQPASLSQSRDERHDDDRNMSGDWM